MSGEVLEINEDGSFDIPSTSKYQVSNDQNIIEPSEADIEVAVANLLSQNDLNALKPGEYKIFLDNDTIIIFFKLSEGEEPKGVRCEDKETFRFHLKTSARAYTIDLPSNFKYEKSSLSSKYHKDHLTARIHCSSN